MHGKRTVAKILREKNRKPNRTASLGTAAIPAVVSVGSWVFEEDENGDLQIRHSETGKTFNISKEGE